MKAAVMSSSMIRKMAALPFLKSNMHKPQLLFPPPAKRQQITTRMYAQEFEDNYDQIYCYGIAFFKKRCLIEIEAK